MRIAYHPSGSSLSAAQLAAWVAAALADIEASPGVIIHVSAPRLPYYFGSQILADDRMTLGGRQYSRINATLRRAALEFQPVRTTAASAWSAWYDATVGGRVPWIWEEPETLELIAVTCALDTDIRRSHRRHWQPSALTLTEWSA